MLEGILIPIVFLGGTVFIAAVILIARDRIENAIWSKRNPPEKIAAERREQVERILHPDWEFYERHLQRPAPTALRELYADPSLITMTCFEYSEDEFINTFSELEEQAIIDANPVLPFEIVPIAVNDFGDPIYLRPGPSEPDVVYITHHDGSDTEVFAESVDSMLATLRRIAASHG